MIMPGSGGTVAGTAVNEWLDDDGNPKYGDESEPRATSRTAEDTEARRQLRCDDKSDERHGQQMTRQRNEARF